MTQTSGARIILLNEPFGSLIKQETFKLNVASSLQRILFRNRLSSAQCFRYHSQNPVLRSGISSVRSPRDVSFPVSTFKTAMDPVSQAVCRTDFLEDRTYVSIAPITSVRLLDVRDLPRRFPESRNILYGIRET